MLAEAGVYEFPDARNPGKAYVGQTSNFLGRMKQHQESGRLTDIGEVVFRPVSGGRFQREIAEQNRINELGGIERGLVSNLKNPIGPKRRPAALREGLVE